LKTPELGPRLRGDGVAEPIEPGARVEILPALDWFLQHWTMGVPHHEESETGFVGDQAFGPFSLPRRCPAQLCFINRVIAEYRAQEIDQPKSEIGVKNPVDSRGSRVLDRPVDQLRLPARLRQSIAVNRGYSAAADVEGGSMRTEGKTEVPLPEVAIPPIMVSSDHHDRHSAPESRECGGHVEATPGYDPGVGEPEVEQIAIDEQAVAQRRHRVQELEKCFLDPGRRHSEVGIGHDHKGAAEHGAKDGLAFSPVQPRTLLAVSGAPSRTSNREASMATSAPSISETMVRVNYSETDQMGVVYHARYLVWLDVARCDHLRYTGMSYRDLEQAGLRLAVSEVAIRYRQPAHYDDLVRIRCWVRDVASRRVDFGYAVEHAGDGHLLATASTSLLALDHSMSLTRLPDQVRQALHPIPDPIKLG
jgi:acyl-CoA thioester hydrolase